MCFCTHWRHSFFERVDRALRRSLGVSESAKTEVNVDPAPPKASKLPDEIEEPSMDPNDFIEFKDFRDSLQPELDRSFGKPRAKGQGHKQNVVLDAEKMREMVKEKGEDAIEDVVAEALKQQSGHPEAAEAQRHDEL
jgi:heat shock protein beta